MLKNKDIYAKVAKIIVQNSKKEDDKLNGIMVISIYYDRKAKTQESKVLINGLKLEVAEDILKSIYANVYAKRVEKDPKMQKLDARLKEKRVTKK